LGDPNFIDDYSHIRLRVNNGAELVILADNSGYIANWSGNPCPEGNFKGGCVEVMAGGKLRDGAFEGFPLGTGAVIVNRAGSSLSVGPEPGSSDAIGPASAVYNDYYSGILIGPWGSDARIEWDTGYSTYDYLEVRSKQIATNAKLTAKKNLGLIYSVWFVGEAKLTINMANNTDALGANEGVGGDDYNFYSQNPTVGLITITQGILDKRFLINGALDFDPSQHVITGTVSINGKAGNQVSYGSGTGISGALVTYP
jgi:hypothetical protein